MKTRNGFTLVEMLVVIGIIGILTGASVVGYSKMIDQAENTRAQELISNCNTALTAYFQKEGFWPQAILNSATGDNLLDEKAALPLAKKGYLSLTVDEDGTRLSGYDKFGVITPWATAVLKKRGSSVTLSTKVRGAQTIRDHILRFAIDEDEDGLVELPMEAGGGKVRATSCVWCISKSGAQLTSWTKGQVKR